MSKKLKLLKLTLVGYNKCYEVVFRNGVNFICGPISKGKSTILEMIDYCLGSKEHEDYIELKEKCNEVYLEFVVDGSRIKIKRSLFDFARQVQVYYWSDQLKDYEEEFEEYKPQSNYLDSTCLSIFLLKLFDLPEIKIQGQAFSFRDIFKYCYLKQNDIDSGNILEEKHYYHSVKRKPTFEIIFNTFSDLLAELKNKEKEQKVNIEKLKIQIEGIYDFLSKVSKEFFDEYPVEKEKLERLIQEKEEELQEIKEKGKTKDSQVIGLKQKLLDYRERLKAHKSNIYELEQYIEKLSLLKNQYNNEIKKLDFIIETHKKFYDYEFKFCPSCFNEIEKKQDGCYLCGQSPETLGENALDAYISEMKKIKKKSKDLEHFLSAQEYELKKLNLIYQNVFIEIKDIEDRINRAQKSYISPYIEKIEELNYEIGEVKTKLSGLQENLKIRDEYYKTKQKADEKIDELKNLREEIKKLECIKNKLPDYIKILSKRFAKILEAFNFPKLNNAYIDDNDYLPYTRGKKYNKLGSGAAITLITTAYYLSILLESIKIPNNNHLGILLIDSPCKNLGAGSKDPEFEDEIISNSILQYFTDLDKNDDDIQLIIVNNIETIFLHEQLVIKRFTKDIGLINDI